MIILGKTPRGYIVEIGDFEMEKLATFDSTGRTFEVGDKPDLHAIYGEVVALQRGIAILKNAAATCGALAETLTTGREPAATEAAS